MGNTLRLDDRLGLVHPAADVRARGLTSVDRLIAECGFSLVLADDEVNEAVGRPPDAIGVRTVRDWLKGNHITAVGFSYRLDPDDGLRLFSAFMKTLALVRALASEGGSVRTLYFAGLPRTCDLVEERFPGLGAAFRGDETPAETLDLLGVPRSLLPPRSAASLAYDEARMAFGRELIREGDCLAVKPIDRSGYHRFGERGDTVAARIAHGTARGLPPLTLARLGPCLPHREEAVALFLEWTERLARGGLLDVLSIETSRLSQSRFWSGWDGMDDGGGVPIRSADEFAAAWRAARPMLVGASAGTGNVRAMAHLLEDSIDIAWHSLPLWWASRIDGRGPNSVMENLRQHVAAMQYAAGTGKPVETDVAGHFSSWGGDDLTYVLSGIVAAKAAKAAGVQRLILHVALNTPADAWGVYDLAKARALLHLVRELEDPDFKVYLQASAGPDHFSRDPMKAKVRLAAAAAMMDDIEPGDAGSPQIISVASYPGDYDIARPDTVEEDIRIARQAIEAYRALRESGEVEDMTANEQVLARTSFLLRHAREAVTAIESAIPGPYEAEGLYEILASGFLAAPELAECKEEFAEAVVWKTTRRDGAVEVVADDGLPIPPAARIAAAAETARSRRSGRT